MHLKFPTALLVALLLASSLATELGDASASSVGGVLTHDAVWTKTGNPYTLSSPFTVAKGISLTIQPGVQVDLNGYTFTVDGQLSAIGDASRISFCNGEIEFTYICSPWLEAAKSGCIIKNAVFNNTKISTLNPIRLADVISDGEVVVDYEAAIITHSNIAVLTINGGTCYIGDNTIETCNIVWGSPVINQNHIKNLLAGNESSGLSCGALIEYNLIKTLNGSGSSPIFSRNNVTTGITYLNGKYPTIADNLVGGGILVSAESPWIYNNTVVTRGPAAGIDINRAASYNGNWGISIVSNNTVYCSGSAAGIALGGASVNATLQGNLVIGGGGIEIYDSGTAYLYDNTILNQNATQNSAAIAVHSDGAFIIQTNLLSQCQSGVTSKNEADLKILNNTITDAQTAITTNGSAKVSQNNILNCTIALKAQGSADVNASNNWWGTVNKTQIVQAIQKSSTSQITYLPALSAPNLAAVPNVDRVLSEAPLIPVFPSPEPAPPAASGPQISLFCHCLSTQPPKVAVQGTLTGDGVALAAQTVTLRFSFNDSTKWQPLASVETDDSGGFSVDWTPTEAGYYKVKADTAGGASSTVYFALAPASHGSFLSVASNSTVSHLSFKNDTKKVSLVLNGTAQSTGYTEIAVPKTVMADASGLMPEIDGTPTVFEVTEQSQCWLVSFSYYQGERHAVLNLDVPSGYFEDASAQGLLVVAIVGSVVAVVTVALWGQRRKAAAIVSK